jgi:hypothetical protein
MTQREIICPHCQQINLRSSGSGLDRLLVNPKYPDVCTLCQTNLKSGQRSVLSIPISWIMWFGIYMVYVVGIIGLCSFPLWFFVLMTARLEQMFIPLLVATSIGLVLGLWTAEEKRRRGELLYKPKRHHW